MRISDWSSDVCSSDLFLEIKRVDFIEINELGELQRPLALQPHRLDLALVEQHIVAALEFKTLHDFAGIDRPDTGHDLFIADRLPGRLVDLAKGHRRARPRGGIDFDRNGDRKSTRLNSSH